MLLSTITVFTLCLSGGLASPSPSPDDAIPEQWRSSVPLTWDHSYRRSEAGLGLNLTDYPNWTFDQIMDGKGQVDDDDITMPS